MPAKNTQLVISALGKDRPGIVDDLSKAIFDLGLNITDSRMTVLGGEFAVISLVEGQWNQLARLEDSVAELEGRLGLVIVTKRTESRDTGQSILPYMVEVVALDHPGIVHSLAKFFSERGINIEDMSTTTYAAPHTGAPIFSVHMHVGIPGDRHISALRDEFMGFCDAMNLDAVLEPLKI
ncbi:MAG: ACT domain-containing protein [Pseudomonadota bacterium]